MPLDWGAVVNRDDSLSGANTPKCVGAAEESAFSVKNTYTRAVAYDPLGDFDIDEFLDESPGKHPAEVDLLPGVGPARMEVDPQPVRRNNFNIVDLIAFTAKAGWKA
jgi:hypothetical protein